MHVLFLSVGGTRRRAVVEESAQVLADGGTATVVVDRAAPWSKETFATGVTVVELAGLEQRRPALRFEQAVLYKAPRKVLRTVGRGPLRRFAKRAEKAYERRIASRASKEVTRLARRRTGAMAVAAWIADWARRLRGLPETLTTGTRSSSPGWGEVPMKRSTWRRVSG